MSEIKTLKAKTIQGLLWSLAEVVVGHGLQFIIGLILARLLTPTDFGLVGMLSVFIAVSASLINSGFSSAIIRKSNTNQTDLSTVFYFNLFVSVLIVIGLQLTSNTIASFFNEPLLTDLLKALSWVLIINALSVIQLTVLQKNVNFKLLTNISITVAIISGAFAIYLAYNGWGVWSLVYMQLSRQFMQTVLLWLFNKWKPSFEFSIDSFKELFGFGSKLLLSGLIDTLYKNIYYFVIGKYFSAQDLGYYTRADQFKNLPAQNLTSVISRVTYPVLAQLKDDQVLLKAGYKRMIGLSMFISFIIMGCMVAVAKPLIITLIGIKWEQSILYFQLLAIPGVLYPLHALNLNMLKVLGRSDLVLKLEILKKILIIPTIYVGIAYGLNTLIGLMILNSIIAYFLNSYWSGKFINYGSMEQLKDILPGFLISVFITVLSYSSSYFYTFSTLWIELIVKLLACFTVILMVSEFTKPQAYSYAKQQVLIKLKSISESK